jgi:leucyl aminopeptidase
MPKLPPSFLGKVGEHIEVTAADGRLIVVGCGKPGEPADEAAFWEGAGAAVIDSLRALKIERATLGGTLQPVSTDASTAARGFAIGATLAAYRCVKYGKQSVKDHFEIKELALQPADWKASAGGHELADSINWARALVDAPANLLNPQTFADEIQSLEALGVEVEILEERTLVRIGAGGLLAVGRGSAHPPCMVICRWRGRRGKSNDLGLVGKGVTFDAGGLNLKTYPGITRMKLDMAGAAAVAATLRVLARRRTPLNVVAALPLCENLIDGKSYRPGDVITSLSGLTIEVDNTDAEGRIVLADGLSYLIKEYQPHLLVDLATLTSAITSALHEEFAGLFTADDELARAIQEAANHGNEPVWRMPLVKQQDYLVDSGIADVKNVGAAGFWGAGMGSATAGAKFLERFTQGTRWAHLDIAGVAWSSRSRNGIPPGPTGYGVRLLAALAERLP